MNRRVFHFWFLAFIVGAFSVAETIAEEAASIVPLDRAELKDKYAFEMQVAQSTFKVRCTYGAITGGGVNEKQLDEYLEVFLPEIGLYPAPLFPAAKIERIVICRDLKFAGQKRSAVPSWENNTLYYDVVSREPPEYKQLVIHHELFHMVDVHDDGKIYQDDAWRRMVPESFAYGRGGRNAQGDSTMNALTNAVPGFVSKYATTGIEEDKAETFAHMILHPRYLQQRSEEEGLLAAKRMQMKRLLSAFVPEMGTDFWHKVEAIERPDDLRRLKEAESE